MQLRLSYHWSIWFRLITLPASIKVWFLKGVDWFTVIQKSINRKLRVATEIGSTFFWFSTIYRAAEIVQNDYLSSA
jgi:hypothetical protein